MTIASDRAHIGRIKSMACIVCDEPGPSDAHHIRTGQGMSQRADDYLAIPLCKECHQGKHGIHGDRSMWKIHKLDEISALALVYRKLLA